MIEEIKQLRVKIDGLALLTEHLEIVESKENTNLNEEDIKFKEFKTIRFKSINVQESTKSLLLAKAWLGKVLAELGTENPYKSGYKTVEDIVSTADTAKIDPGITSSGEDTYSINGNDMLEYESRSYIGKIDYLRTEIQNIIDNTTDFSEQCSNIELEQGFVYKYLSEAKFWLGFELQKIKETENK